MPPPRARPPEPPAHSRADEEHGNDAEEDERTLPFPYAGRFEEWVADETEASETPQHRRRADSGGT